MAYVCALLVLVYALFGMYLFMGKTASCNDATRTRQQDCVGEYVDAHGVTAPRWWGNPDTGNFDSIGVTASHISAMTTIIHIHGNPMQCRSEFIHPAPPQSSRQFDYVFWTTTTIALTAI